MLMYTSKSIELLEKLQGPLSSIINGIWMMDKTTEYGSSLKDSANDIAEELEYIRIILNHVFRLFPETKEDLFETASAIYESVKWIRSEHSSFKHEEEKSVLLKSFYELCKEYQSQ